MRKELWPVLLLVGFGVLIFAPVLFLGKAFYGEEQIGFYYAISDYVRQALQYGWPLLWQSGHFGGVSASLDQFVGAWYPFNLFLFSILPTFAAHHLSITVATTAGLLLAYAFGRRQGWRRSTSVVLALGYFAATTYGWLQIGTIAAHSFAMLPALLLALCYTRNSAVRLWAVLGGGIALGIGFVAGFMQVVFYAYLVAGAYALFLDWEGCRQGVSWWRSLPASFSYAGMTLLGFALGFLQFYPSAHLIDETIRTSTYAAQTAYQPLPTELIAFLMPPYFTVPIIGGGVSGGFYLGALGFVFALLGLLVYRTRVVVFFALLYALIAAVAFHLPGFGWLNEHIPPFSHMGAQFRWMLGAAFPLAYIGAAGVEGFLRNPEKMTERVQRYVLWGSALLCGVLVAGSVALRMVASVLMAPEWSARIVAWYSTRKTLVYPLEHYQTVLAQAIGQVTDTFSLLNVRFSFGVFCWVLVVGFFVALQRQWIPRTQVAAAIVALTIFAVGGSTVLQWSDFVPQNLYTQKPALVSFLENREDDPHAYRIMGLLLGDGLFQKLTSHRRLTPEESTLLQHETLTNNVNLYFGIERMDGMEPYRTLRANRLLNTVVGYDTAAYVFDDASPLLQTSKLDQLYNRDVQKSVPIEVKIADLQKRLPLFSMMNVKYLYTPFELEDPRIQLMAKIPLSVATSSYLYVYENPQALPRIYFAHEAHFVGTAQHESLRRVIAEVDFGTRTWIECATCAASTTSSGEVQVRSYIPGKVEVEARTQKGGWLVFGESFLPGWEARIDGVQSPLYAANYLFQAVYVPPGTHAVSFVYTDVTMVQLGALFD